MVCESGTMVGRESQASIEVGGEVGSRRYKVG